MKREFSDRNEAGRRLAMAVLRLGLVAPVVLALPRGGVPVAFEVAKALHAPLDLMIVRKIGAPGQPELAVGAVAEGESPTVVVDDETSRLTGADAHYIARQAETQREVIAQRRTTYRHGRPPLDLRGRTVVVVDDGIATGTTVRAALQALRRMQPARLVLAVPVAPADTLADLSALVDDLVCLARPRHFGAVGAHYADFRQLEDGEVVALLEAARAGIE